MSLTALRNPLCVRTRTSLREALREEGYAHVAGRLVDLVNDPRQLSLEDIEALEDLADAPWSERDSRIETILQGKSSGARYIGRRIAQEGASSLKEYCSDWAALKEVRRWMKAQDQKWLESMHLAFVNSAGEWKVQAGRLFHLGIRFAWQAERFCHLYAEVCNPKRPWGSCYQPCHGKVKALALTRNYTKLPMWVKKQMVKSSVWIPTEENGDRIGDIWQYLDCAKAWKWCPSLPKGIACRVGKLSPKMRALADRAWRSTSSMRDGMVISASEQKSLFWERMAALSKMSLGEILNTEEEWNVYYAQRMVEIYCDLPHKFLRSFLDLPEKGLVPTAQVLEWVANYATPSDACLHLFGCKGKTVVSAFKNAKNTDAIKWAVALGVRNPDQLQKWLGLSSSNCVVFQKDAIEFLKHLKPEVALRLVSTTTFKIRGEVKSVEDYLVRDTGYLWSKIKEKPELGRTRCWLTIHEELARKFIAEQPDEALPVSTKYLPLQGLCAVNRSWEIQLPTRTATLVLWGELLHHCVGAYGPKIKQGECVILGVRLDGVVRYTVEMVGSRCQQFYGDRNSEAPTDLRDSVLKALAQAGI